MKHKSGVIKNSSTVTKITALRYQWHHLRPTMAARLTKKIEQAHIHTGIGPGRHVQLNRRPIYIEGFDTRARVRHINGALLKIYEFRWFVSSSVIFEATAQFENPKTVL
jgi:hypothetical protein